MPPWERPDEPWAKTGQDGLARIRLADGSRSIQGAWQALAKGNGQGFGRVEASPAYAPFSHVEHHHADARHRNMGALASPKRARETSGRLRQIRTRTPTT